MPTVEIDLERHIEPENLKINPDFKRLIPKLGKKEFDQLSANILSEGCRHPILNWNGYIVDGHHRYEICTKHKIPFRTVPLKPHPEDEEAVKAWMIRNALGTRILTKYEQIELARELDSLDYISHQGKRTDLEKNLEIEELEKQHFQREKKHIKKFKELQSKPELTRDEKSQKRMYESRFSISKDRLRELQTKENLDPEEQEDKDFLEYFFSELRGELQNLKNKKKRSDADKRRIGVLNKYLFGINKAEEIAKKEQEKRLQELQDKDSLSSKEKKEKEKLARVVYDYQTSVQICTEVDEEGLTADEQEDSSLIKEQKPSQKTAKSLGISSCTLSKSRYIEKHADENLKQELREGKKSIDGAYRKLKAQKWDYVGCFPKNSYRVFYADFWKEDKYEYKDHIPYKFEDLIIDIPKFGIHTIKDFKDLPVKEFINQREGAVCFLWSSLKKVESTISIMKAWGFSYRTLFILKNTRKFEGVYNSSDSLVVIVGACVIDWSLDSSGLASSALKNLKDKVTHAWEPDNDCFLSSVLDKSIAGKDRALNFRKVIDQMYTSGNKIQLFSDDETPTWDAILR